MIISASISNDRKTHTVYVQTGDSKQKLQIPMKEKGMGSAVNGGEFLQLALATCYCNDIYREAAQKNITITKVDVFVSAEFSGVGESGFNFTYSAKLEGDASETELKKLVKHTDTVAEIHNTLRKGAEIKLIEKD